MTAAPDGFPPLLDLADWEDADPRAELVAGFVTMPPSEGWNNLRSATLLGRALEHGTGGAFVAVQQLDVVLSEVPATVRCPDLVLAARGALTGATRAYPSDVALVAEAVSPGSVETDWITKRAEYARAGIPAYLIVDLRPDMRRLALFTRPGAEGYTHSTGGETVVVELGGHRVVVTLADLTD